MPCQAKIHIMKQNSTVLQSLEAITRTDLEAETTKKTILEQKILT
jgi:hypothetical protein